MPGNTRLPRRLFLITGIGIILAGLLMVFSPALADRTDKPILVFDKVNPKPTYWEWGEKYWPAKPVRGGIFRRATNRYVGLMNPNHWPVNDWSLIGLFYEGITNTDGAYRMKRNPWLCESIVFLAPNVVDLHLEKGITYHDGTPFNAVSLKYQTDWMLDRKNGCWTRTAMKRFKKIEVIDEYTLRFHTKAPWAGLPAGFMSFAISARALQADVAQREAKSWAGRLRKARGKLESAEQAAQKAGDQAGDGLKKALDKARKEAAAAEAAVRLWTEKARDHVNTDQHPVGTGSFMFDKASPGNYVQVKRNPNWWFARKSGNPDMPYFDGIRTTVIPDPSIRLANLKAGKIDTIVLGKEQYLLVKDDPNFNVYAAPAYHTQMLGFNHAGGPCKDIRVRQAISHAIDRKALVHGTQFGLGIVASCVFPQSHWAHNPDLKPVEYDPDQSRKLLAEAGYAKGLTITGYAGNDAAGMTVAEAIKNMLAKVGIDWKVDILDVVAANDRMKNLEYDLAHMPIGFIQDPDTVPTYFYLPNGAFNYGRSNNQKAVEFFLKGRDTIIEAERQQHYFAVEKALYDNYEDVWLWWEVGAVAYRKAVQGYNHEMYLKDLNAYSVSHPLWFKEGRP